VNTGTTPSGMVMVLVLMLGIAAAVLIMTLSKRTSNS
jgi:F0F1-type ATP synthase assembly protein I